MSGQIQLADSSKPTGAGSALGGVADAAKVVLIDSSTGLPYVAGAGGGGGGAVTIADGADATLGAKADASATTDTGTFSLIALFKRLLTKTNPQAAPYTAQQKATASAVALTAHALLNGLVVTANASNTGTILIGPAGITATNDGTGTGYALTPGQSVAIAASDASQVSIIGASGFAATDFVYIVGN